VQGALAPSSDAVTHAYIYRQLPDVGGIVHTHSRYATAWAARHEPVPCSGPTPVPRRTHGRTWGVHRRPALKSAVMCEDVARTVHLARQLGEPQIIPAEAVDRLWHRYQHAYGQRADRG
jgi:L-ribulose-5-phosphate 4-epimerase